MLILNVSTVSSRLCNLPTFLLFAFVWFRSSVKKVENRLRHKFSGLIPYTKGLLTEDPLENKYLEDFHLIIINHVLQAVCPNMEYYTKALKKLKAYMKPGGHICVLDPLQETHAKIGNVKFKNYPLVYDEVIKSFREAGLEIVNSSKKAIIGEEELPVDASGWHLTLARKVWRLPENIQDILFSLATHNPNYSYQFMVKISLC